MLFFIMKSESGWKRYIVFDPGIQGGRPVFRGTRIPITVVLEYLEAGMAIDDILRGFPSLNRKAVQAALHYLLLRVQEEEFIPLAQA